MTRVNNLSLIYWNIDGARYKIDNGPSFNKLDEDDVASKLIANDIVCLVETHCSYADNLRLDGFCSAVQNIRPKSPGAPKFSGGIAILVKQKIRNGITFMPIKNSEYMCMKLNHNFFNLPRDIYVIVVYISNGSFAQKSDDILDLVEEEVANFTRDGSQVLICGDFNAHTASLPDYCTDDDSDRLFQEVNIPLMLRPTEDIPMKRNNMDKQKVDKRGKKLLDFCKSTETRLLNGRCFGDTFGHYTCFSHTGNPSTIDYILASSPLLNSVKTFQVDELSLYSIHTSLSLSLSTGFHTLHDKNNFTDSRPLKKIIWSEGDDIKFNETLQNCVINGHFNSFNSLLNGENTSSESIDEATECFTNIISSAATKAGLRVRVTSTHNRYNAKKKGRHKPWFNRECRILKYKSEKLAKSIKQDPFNNGHRFEFMCTKKKYKSLVKKNKEMYEKNIWSNLNSLQRSNPKEFWKLF